MNFSDISDRQFLSQRYGGLCISAIVLSASFLIGCATTGVGGNAKVNVDLLYKDIDAELARGQNEKAIALLNQAAKESPTSMVPWLKMANIWFETGNYPSAILAASEVLQRDAANQDAKSLLVVAGLRVAAGAVTGLLPNGAVNLSARVEAENLTNSLRGVLGEKILVPGPNGEARPTGYTPRSKPRASTSTNTGFHSAGAQSNSSASSLDPFKSLK